MSFLNLKTAAAAVTFAVATMGTAQAADVEIYGLIDEGLMFTQAETDGNVKKIPPEKRIPAHKNAAWQELPAGASRAVNPWVTATKSTLFSKENLTATPVA